MAKGMEFHLARRAYVIPTTKEYYELFATMVRAAREQILIAGWDFQPELRLLRYRDGQGEELALGDLLVDLARENPALDIRIISWNYSLLLATTGEILSQAAWTAKLPDNVHFEFDPAEAAGGSHHHKVCVIDDRIAFVGGIDLSVRRWDTAERPPSDSLRVDPAGTTYDPWHDVQMMVEGDAARRLGELVREQWSWEADDEAPVPLRTSGRGLEWPDVEPDFENIDLGLVKTWPSKQDGCSMPDEIAPLYEKLIRDARHYVYIENQYLTNAALIEALEAKLAEEDGPEVILVVPARMREWYERASFGIERDRVAKRLRARDPHGRLRIVTPWSSDATEERDVYVHAKVIVVDDEHLIVGSANFAERSTHVDTEICAYVSTTHGARPESIRNVRDRLMGIHLGHAADVVSFEIDRLGSLRALIDATAHDEGAALRPLVTDDAGRAELIPMWFADPRRSVWREPRMWLVVGAMAGVVATGFVLARRTRRG